LLEKSRAEKSCDFVSLIKANNDYKWEEPEKIANFVATYDTLKQKVSKTDLKNLIEEVIEKTRILEFYSNSKIDNKDNINALEKLIEEAQKFQKIHKSVFLNEFLEHLDIAYQNDLNIDIGKDESKQNAIQLMTLHGAKGREFEYVFMPELCAKKWEKYSNPEQLKVPVDKTSFEKESEQLRLLFVGMTRAKHKLYMSFPASINERPHFLSEYIEAISAQNSLIHSQIFTPENGFMKEEDKILKKLNFDYKIHLGDKLKEIIKTIELSPSSIDKYDKCPRQFLYSQVYRIPSKIFDTKNIDYGNAIHKTLEDAAKFAMKNKCYQTLAEILTEFEKNLEKMEIKNTLVHDSLLERGQNALKEFYPHFSEISPERISEIESHLGFMALDGIKLTGKIDRIEINNDGTYFLIDYKTGSSPGAGKTADKKHLDQIRFYKLAFELKNSDKKVSHVSVIYVEDFEKNYIKEVCAEDDILIKEKILETYKNIQNLKFEAICNKQSTDICKRCNYKLLCKLHVI
jgi:DNA helicase-2/ATP-dependent DNA helicase PcrA